MQCGDADLPPYESLLLRYWGVEDHPGFKLWKVAESCEGVSGRRLGRAGVLGLGAVLGARGGVGRVGGVEGIVAVGEVVAAVKGALTRVGGDS